MQMQLWELHDVHEEFSASPEDLNIRGLAWLSWQMCPIHGVHSSAREGGREGRPEHRQAPRLVPAEQLDTWLRQLELHALRITAAWRFLKRPGGEIERHAAGKSGAAKGKTGSV